MEGCAASAEHFVRWTVAPGDFIRPEKESDGDRQENGDRSDPCPRQNVTENMRLERRICNMKKAEIYQYLTGKGISYEVTEHGAVSSMEDLAAMDLPYPDSDAKKSFCAR